MATIVWSAATNGSGAKGTLFEGNTFWLSQRVPQRSRFVAEIEVSKKSRERIVPLIIFCRLTEAP